MTSRITSATSTERNFLTLAGGAAGLRLWLPWGYLTE